MSLKLPPPPDQAVRMIYDPDRRLYWVPVSADFMPELVSSWSDPLRVKIVDGELVFQRLAEQPA